MYVMRRYGFERLSHQRLDAITLVGQITGKLANRRLVGTSTWTRIATRISLNFSVVLEGL